MRLGFALPQVGGLCDSTVIAKAVQLAEELGYASGWVNDRMLWPTAPQAPYPASADGSLPDVWQRNLDALDVLTFAAAHSTKLRLGTSVLVLPWYNPVLLARRLASLDMLSDGRLTTGFGIGWSPDEYCAAGVPMAGQARRFEDSLTVLEKILTGGIVEHSSEFVSLSPSIFDAKAVQRPRPPVYLAAYSPSGLARIARRADGWIPTGVPIAMMVEMRHAISSMATAAGRDPAEIGCIVRANVHLATGSADGDDRPPFCGSLTQVLADIERCAELGFDEVFVDVQFSPGGDIPDQYFEHLGQFSTLI